MKLSALKTKVPPTAIILQLAENMNNVKSKKYDATCNEIEQKSLSSEKFKTLFKFHGIEQYKKKKTFDGLDRYDQRKYPAKNRKLRENLKYW